MRSRTGSLVRRLRRLPTHCLAQDRTPSPEQARERCPVEVERRTHRGERRRAAGAGAAVVVVVVGAAAAAAAGAAARAVAAVGHRGTLPLHLPGASCLLVGGFVASRLCGNRGCPKPRQSRARASASAVGGFDHRTISCAWTIHSGHGAGATRNRREQLAASRLAFRLAARNATK